MALKRPKGELSQEEEARITLAISFGALSSDIARSHQYAFEMGRAFQREIISALKKIQTPANVMEQIADQCSQVLDGQKRSKRDIQRRKIAADIAQLITMVKTLSQQMIESNLHEHPELKQLFEQTKKYIDHMSTGKYDMHS